MTAPTLRAGGVIRAAFGPMRRAASGNVLMITHIAMALGRLGRGESQYGEDEIRRQLTLIAKEIERSGLLEEDRELIAGLV